MIEWSEETGNEWLIEQGYLVRDSRHNRGGAIDLSFYILETGELMDMGTDWDFFGVESHAFSVSGLALDNRLLLRSSMQEVALYRMTLSGGTLNCPMLPSCPWWMCRILSEEF